MTGAKDIRGVDTKQRGREPRQMGRMQGPGMSAPETIQPGQYPDGQDRMGIDVKNIDTTASSQGYKDGEKHRAALRGDPK